MAHYYPKPALAFLLISNIFLAIAGPALAGRAMIPTPTEAAKYSDKKVLHPQSFIDTDGSFLIPGIGRFMIPGANSNFDPFTYNPVTGISGGGPVGGSGDGIIGSGGGASRNYIPGGDDTFVPNPGVEIPIPGSGGGNGISTSTPAVARP